MSSDKTDKRQVYPETDAGATFSFTIPPVDKNDRSVTPKVYLRDPFALAEAIGDEPRWLCWMWSLTEKGRWTKPPVSVVNGSRKRKNDDDLVMGSTSDPATWGGYTDAKTLCANIPKLGLGIALSRLKGIAVIDLDNVIVTEADGTRYVLPEAWEIINRAGSYTEFSPSGTGLKIYGLVPEETLSGKSKLHLSAGGQVELFHDANFYVCVTGHTLPGYEALQNIGAVYGSLLQMAAKQAERNASAAPSAEREQPMGGSTKPPPDARQRLELRYAARAIARYAPEQVDDYEKWVSLGEAFKSGGDDLFPIWMEMSATSSKYDRKEMLSVWDSFGADVTDWKKVFNEANRACERAGVENWYKAAEREINAELSGFGGLRVGAGLKFEEPPEDPLKISGLQFVLDGQIPVGSMVIAGFRGIGKTTMLVSLAALITWMCDSSHPMRPRIKRRVIWITEDVEQVWRIIGAMMNQRLMISERDTLRDMIKVVRANRSDPKELAAALRGLPEELDCENVFERGTLLAKPLIILDTLAATVDLSDENSNAEMSRAVANVRQAVPGASIWFITHTAKAHNRAGAIAEITSRGASSLESDVQGTAVLAREDEVHDKRYLVLGKKRFTEDFNEITATVGFFETTTSELWGDRKERFSYALLEKSTFEDRENDKDQAIADRAARRADAERSKIIDALSGLLGAARAAGKKGIAWKSGSGGGNQSAPLPGYEQYARTTKKTIREALGLLGGGNDKTLVAALKLAATDVDDEEEVYVFDAADFSIPGIENGPQT